MEIMIKLDEKNIVKRNSIDAIQRYNIWKIDVYVSGNRFRVNLEHDFDKKDREKANLFVNALHLLIDREQDNGIVHKDLWKELQDDWGEFDGTFKEFIGERLNNPVNWVDELQAKS